MNTKYEPIIGLEVHVELKTNSKMFCGCPADHFGKEPNTQTCPVCLAMPGGLPVPNKKAIEWTIKLGLALNCEIPLFSKFDRKHYFYPDLPKGYQISQYDMPFCRNGSLVIARSETTKQSNGIASPAKRDRNDTKTIRINRVHLEEDTGKLQHVTVDNERLTLVDFNRSGVPLVEIVTEPDFHTIEEVDQYVKKLQRIVRYLGISDADMEKGSMRIEPSISMRQSTKIASPREAGSRDDNEPLPKYRVELKNINSFRFVRKAIEYEINRQTEMLERGEEPSQQTRGYNEAKNITVAQREKEEAHDYRYFPEPDIPPMRWDKYQTANIKDQIGELPDEKYQKFLNWGLPPQYAFLASENIQTAKFIEESNNLIKSLKDVSIRDVANFIFNQRIYSQSMSAVEVVARIQAAKNFVKESVPNEVLMDIIKNKMEENPKAVEDYKKGKTASLMFLVGQVKRLLKEKGDAELIKQKLIDILT